MDVERGQVEGLFLLPLSHEDVGEEDATQKEESVRCQSPVHYEHHTETLVELQTERILFIPQTPFFPYACILRQGKTG